MNRPPILTADIWPERPSNKLSNYVLQSGIDSVLQKLFPKNLFFRGRSLMKNHLSMGSSMGQKLVRFSIAIYHSIEHQNLSILHAGKG